MRTLTPILGAAFGLLLAIPQAFAWNPPEGVGAAFAKHPNDFGGILKKGHGWITQAGIAILRADGYWYAADSLEADIQAILSGNRWEDEKDGRQTVSVIACPAGWVSSRTGWIPWIGPIIHDLSCSVNLKVLEIDSWPASAVNHYYNPTTRTGLDLNLYVNAEFAAALVTNNLTSGIARLDVNPDVAPTVSAPTRMMERYNKALGIFNVTAALESIGVWTSPNQQTKFFLGAAVHLVQDLNVVHHTFGEWGKNHTGYENRADEVVSSWALPQAGEGWTGRYLADVPAFDCGVGEPRCLATHAAQLSHVQANLNAAQSGNYSAVEAHVKSAAEFTAGLFHKYLVDIGQEPFNVPAALMAVL